MSKISMQLFGGVLMLSGFLIASTPTLSSWNECEAANPTYNTTIVTRCPAAAICANATQTCVNTRTPRARACGASIHRCWSCDGVAMRRVNTETQISNCQLSAGACTCPYDGPWMVTATPTISTCSATINSGGFGC